MSITKEQTDTCLELAFIIKILEKQGRVFKDIDEAMEVAFDTLLNDETYRLAKRDCVRALLI